MVKVLKTFSLSQAIKGDETLSAKKSQSLSEARFYFKINLMFKRYFLNIMVGVSVFTIKYDNQNTLLFFSEIKHKY